MPNRHKKSKWPKKAKKSQISFGLFSKIKKKSKELKKGQKLQIWPQKSQTGNPAQSWSYSHLRGSSGVKRNF